jgi:inorganic triphosphatase YgiF
MEKSDGASTETELKLLISKGSEKRLAEHPIFEVLHATKAKTERIVTTYFDSPDQDLARRGMSLRVRRSGSKRIQTVKSGSGGGPATGRTEREWPLSGDKPDVSLVTRAMGADAIPREIQDDLQPTVVTDVVRTTRTLRFDGSRIEAAIDSGSIAAGQKKQPIHELELELGEGRPGALYRLALALHAATPLEVEVESKAARGNRLRSGDAPKPKEESHVSLARDVTGLAALRQIVASGLDHLLSNKSAALAGDAEGIHQARVAIRRLRSALLLFEPRLDARTIAAFQGELKRIGKVIGEARDWDVFSLEMLPKSFGDIKEGDWGSLMREAADCERQSAEASSAAEIEAPSFTALVLGLSAWVEEDRGRKNRLGDEDLERPLLEIAPKLLDRLARKVERRGRRLGARASATELHLLRKSLKKLRYSVDFVSALYPRKAVKRFVRRTKDLLKTLGDINDAETAITLSERLAENRRVDLAGAVSILAHNQRQSTDAALPKLEKQWAAFQREDRFWRGGA